MEIFKDYAYYYNMIYRDKDYFGEAKTVFDLLSKNSLYPIKNILNLGCGTGRHDRELSKMGSVVTGVDFSDSMISIAQETNKEFSNTSFVVGDARYFCDEKKYDAVISLFHVMSYQNTNIDVSHMMNTAYKELESGGLFLFDVWYGPGVLTDRPEVRKKVLEDENNVIIRFANPEIHPNDNLVDVNYEIMVIDKATSVVSKINETHKMRYFFMPEIEYMLQMNGFELLDCVDCNLLKEPSFDSWTVYFIAKKK